MKNIYQRTNLKVAYLYVLLGVSMCLLYTTNTAQAQVSGVNVITSYEDAIVLWRGFGHQWTYNHRLNRLGSYIENPKKVDYPYKASLHHTSATGTGADVGIYDGQYTFIAANGVNMMSGEENLAFEGKEGKLHIASKIIEVDYPGINYPEGTFEVVLNGFDIASEQKADKLHMFRLSVGEVEYVTLADKIRFRLDVALLVRCQSLECNRFNNKFEYDLKVKYVVLNGGSGFKSLEKNLHKVYDWNKNEELEAKATPKQIQGIGGNVYPDAAIAFKSISITLNQPHWFLEWHSSIQPRHVSNYYNPSTGIYKYNSTMLFKQWTDQMKKESAYAKHSRYSSKKSGWAAIDGTIALLQFSDAYVMHRQAKGIIKWKGSNSPSQVDDALKIHHLVFGEDILSIDETELQRMEEAENAKIKKKYDVYVEELERLKEEKKEEKKQVKELKKYERKENK